MKFSALLIIININSASYGFEVSSSKNKWKTTSCNNGIRSHYRNADVSPILCGVWGRPRHLRSLLLAPDNMEEEPLSYWMEEISAESNVTTIINTTQQAQTDVIESLYLQNELKKNVLPKVIQSAMITAFFPAYLATKSVPVAIISAISTSYLAITSGTIGDFVRTIGNVTSDLGEQFLNYLKDVNAGEKLSNIASLSFDVGIKAVTTLSETAANLPTISTTSNDTKEAIDDQLLVQEEVGTHSMDDSTAYDDDDLQRMLYEAAEAEREAQEAADELKHFQENKLAEEKRLLEQEVTEMDKIREEFIKMNEKSKFVEDIANLESGLGGLKAAEEERLVQELMIAQQAAKEKLLEKEQKAAEEQRLEQEFFAAKQAAKEKRLVEERNAAEEKRREQVRIAAQRAAEGKRLEKGRKATEGQRLEQERLVVQQAAKEKSLEGKRKAAEEQRLDQQRTLFFNLLPLF